MLITPINKTILINNFSFDKKFSDQSYKNELK